MNYAVLTDSSTGAQNMMNGLSGVTKVRTFTAHILWLMQNSSVADVNTMQNSSYTYASILLPNPL